MFDFVSLVSKTTAAIFFIGLERRRCTRMDFTVDLSWEKKGTKFDIIFRRCNQANGEGAVNDVRIKDIYLTL